MAEQGCAMQTRLEQTYVVPNTRGWWARGWKHQKPLWRGGGFCCSVCVGGVELGVGRVGRTWRREALRDVGTARGQWVLLPAGGHRVWEGACGV